jgi:uncharacterized protein involved in exopolysaccharide biosynthesis
LKSRAIAERVVSKQQLQDVLRPRSLSLFGAIRSIFSAGSQKKASVNERSSVAVGIVVKNISIRPVTGSRLVNLSYTDPNPARAQRIANAYAKAYVDSSVDKRFEANSYAKIFLDDQIKQLKLRLEQSEKALLNFAEQEKIVEVNDKTSIAKNNLAAANVALGKLVSDRIKNEQSWHQVESAKAINLPQLLSNNVIDGLRLQRNNLKRDYKEKLQTFKPSYPAMVEISNKIKEIDHQLTTEVKTIKDSLRAAYESSLNQENEMKARIEKLRSEVLDMQKKGIQYNILKREVETNRGLYNNLLQRYKEVDIASGARANNIFIVDRALMPGAPSEPRIMRILLLSLLLGLGTGFGTAYLLEMFDDRLRLFCQAAGSCTPDGRWRYHKYGSAESSARRNDRSIPPFFDGRAQRQRCHRCPG